MVVFYRGLHCPICKNYLTELQKLQPKFNERGVEVIVLSSDSEERATEAKSSWGLGELAIAHSVDLATARSWGLYVSAGRGKTSIGVEEPDLFSEPGLFLVRPDGTLYFGAVQTMFPLGEFPTYADKANAAEYGFTNPLAIEFGFWGFLIWGFYFLTSFYFCVIEPRVKFFEIPFVKILNNIVIIGTCR